LARLQGSTRSRWRYWCGRSCWCPWTFSEYSVNIQWTFSELSVNIQWMFTLCSQGFKDSVNVHSM
jgi:hypothetical protein